MALLKELFIKMSMKEQRKPRREFDRGFGNSRSNH